MKFRRATHDQKTNEYIYRELSYFEQKVWDAHGNILHMLKSDIGLSYDELLEEIRNDTTNFDYHPNDLAIWRDGENLPNPKDVALSLIRLMEAKFVEVING